MTGNEYADLIAAYLTKNYRHRGLRVYREVSLGKSIIGKNRRVDMLAVHDETQRALAVECKYQTVAGTADEKLPYAIQDLQALSIPATIAYAGEGFSQGVLHMLQGSPTAAYCMPGFDLQATKLTLELDHLVATTFQWWEAVLKLKQPFNLEEWGRKNDPHYQFLVPETHGIPAPRAVPRPEPPGTLSVPGTHAAENLEGEQEARTPEAS